MKRYARKIVADAPLSRYNLLTHPFVALIPVLLLSFLVNFNVLFNDFGWDDEDIIKNIRLTDRWWNPFPLSLIADPSSKEVAPYYRPLVSFSYLLDFMIWGSNPFGFHLSVFLSHLLNTALT